MVRNVGNVRTASLSRSSDCHRTERLSRVASICASPHLQCGPKPMVRIGAPSLHADGGNISRIFVGILKTRRGLDYCADSATEAWGAENPVPRVPQHVTTKKPDEVELARYRPTRRRRFVWQSLRRRTTMPPLLASLGKAGRRGIQPPVACFVPHDSPRLCHHVRDVAAAFRRGDGAVGGHVKDGVPA